MSNSKLVHFALFATIAGLQFAAAVYSPWLAMATAILFGLSLGAVSRAIGLSQDNPWKVVGLTMAGCLVGVLAAAPVAVAEPQGVAALSPSAALLSGIARVLIGQRRTR